MWNETALMPGNAGLYGRSPDNDMDKAAAPALPSGGGRADGCGCRDGFGSVSYTHLGPDAEGEGEAGEPETFVPEEAQLEERINAMIPSTIDDILSFADSYDAPEQVEAVFKWDVDDIFYNYFFVGNYICLLYTSRCV